MDSNMLLYAFGEVAILLLCICIYLLLHLKSLKKLIKKLEEKILALRNTIVSTKKNAKALIAEAREEGVVSYLDYIEAQLANTRDFHQLQSPDRDIVLDLDVEVELERQVAALRNAFLVAEKEASYASDEEDKPSWAVLKAKLEQLINFYQHAFKSEADAASGAGGIDEAEFDQLQQELNNYKKRVGSLEKFKKLFFDMEGKWSTAKAEAEDYYQQLKARANAIDAGEDFNQLLDQYAASYSSLDVSFEDGRTIEGGGATTPPERAEGIDSGDKPVIPEKVYIKNQDEVDRLRNMMANQHGIIAQLKEKLRDSAQEGSTEEDKETLFEEMSVQLDKQEKFLKESEVCIQLLEDELDAAQLQIKDLSDALARFQGELGADSSSDAANNVATEDEGTSKTEAGPSQQEIEELVAGYITESRDMLNTISLLEQENQQLKEQLENGDFGGASDTSSDSDSNEEAKELREKLSEVQQELLNIQTQHIELEERYIELKTSSL